MCEIMCNFVVVPNSILVHSMILWNFKIKLHILFPPLWMSVSVWHQTLVEHVHLWAKIFKKKKKKLDHENKSELSSQHLSKYSAKYCWSCASAYLSNKYIYSVGIFLFQCWSVFFSVLFCYFLVMIYFCEMFLAVY